MMIVDERGPSKRPVPVTASHSRRPVSFNTSHVLFRRPYSDGLAHEDGREDDVPVPGLRVHGLTGFNISSASRCCE